MIPRLTIFHWLWLCPAAVCLPMFRSISFNFVNKWCIGCFMSVNIRFHLNTYRYVPTSMLLPACLHNYSAVNPFLFVDRKSLQGLREEPSFLSIIILMSITRNRTTTTTTTTSLRSSCCCPTGWWGGSQHNHRGLLFYKWNRFAALLAQADAGVLEHVLGSVYFCGSLQQVTYYCLCQVGNM